MERAWEPARVPLSFGTKESLSPRHLSLPGGPRLWGAWGWRRGESLCAPGLRGQAKSSRASCGGLCASPMQGGGQHGVWAQSWGWGGAARRLEPSPLFSPPPPGRVRSTKPSAHAPAAPRPKSQPARSTREGVGNSNFFPVPKWTREFSFLQSFPYPPKRRVADRQGSCCTHRDSGGGQWSVGALNAGGFVGAP